MMNLRRFAMALVFVAGCGGGGVELQPCPVPTQTDLATAEDMSTASDLSAAPTLPTGAGPGARCDVEADCDGIASAQRYCATDIYEPSGSRGYCLQAIQLSPGAYHVYWGDPNLARDGGGAYCDMSGLSVNLLPRSTFLCGTFSTR